MVLSTPRSQPPARITIVEAAIVKKRRRLGSVDREMFAIFDKPTRRARRAVFQKLLETPTDAVGSSVAVTRPSLRSAVTGSCPDKTKAVRSAT